MLSLPSAILPPWSALTRVSGLLCILSGVLFFISMRSFTRELSISRRLGLLLVLSGVAWGAVVLIESGTMTGGSAEGDRLRLLRTLNREALTEAALENAQSMREMVSLDLPGPGGAVVNSLGDATGATLGVIVGTVSGAGTLDSRRHEPIPRDTLRGAGRFVSLGMLLSLGALITMLALLEGMVMVDRTGATQNLFWIVTGAIMLHASTTALGFGGEIVVSVMKNPLNLSFLLVLLAAAILAGCQKWIHYLNRNSRIFVMAGALLFAEFSRRVMTVCVADGMPGYGTDTVSALMGTIAMLLMIYGFGSFLTMLIHMPSARLLDKRYGELDTLQDLSHSLHSSFEPGQLASAATRLGKRLTGADCCWIVPAEKSAGFPTVWCGDNCDFTGDIPPEWYRFLSGRLDATGRGLLFNNYRRTSLERLFSGRGRIGSLLASQVEVRGEHLGLLLASCGKSFRFVDHTRGLFDSFARQIAQAFHNARLFGEKLELERLQRELDLAREIQQQLFPKVIPQPAGYEIAAINIPCSVVGGDYYDVIQLENGDTALAIADVAGKGAAASILMAGLQASLRSLLLGRNSLSELMPVLNMLVCSQVPDGSFITMFLGILSGRDGRLEYCSAGHDPPIVLRADGTSERPDVGGLVLGVDPGARYRCGTIVLEPGDRLLAFTDGVTDAFSPEDDEPFGIERLLNAMAGHREESSEGLVTTFVRLLDSWVGEEPHTDDVTMLVATRLDETGETGNNKNNS
jgi:serine phosphatase RsbU (regulator of sigma subunit)